MKIGFIGAGNMASAMISGLIAKQFIEPNNIAIFDVSQNQMDIVAQKYGVHQLGSQRELVESCEFIVLAVKPVYMEGVLQNASAYATGKKFISIAAGWTVAMLRSALNEIDASILRCMPNTPLMVGEGFTALCTDTSFDETDVEYVKDVFQTLGSVAMLPERLFDAIIAVAGSAPAYVFVFVEALIDAGIKQGLPRDIATKACEQTLFGAAKLLMETGEHPAKLKDMVCSPGGTTIEAIASLESTGFRHSIIQAASVCAEKSNQLSKKTK